MTTVDIDEERAALGVARRAVETRLNKLAGLEGHAADEITHQYVSAVISASIEKLQQELLVFGRIDDDRPWRIGLYGIDDGGEQLVVDWRAPFARAFYQAGFGDSHDLERRVSYVGCIDDLLVEEFRTGEVVGSSPLLAELSRSRGEEMRAAVATLQAEQDELVRRDPEDRLVLRGGPGTGKTVVGLHRAAWIVYNDRRLTADKILVIGPSDQFLRYVSTVLPTLGEARVAQTTFERLFGPSLPAANEEGWLDVLDRFETQLCRPGPIPLGPRRAIPEDEVADMIGRLRQRALPWRERRKIFVEALSRTHDVRGSEISSAARAVWPPMSAKQVMTKLGQRSTLLELGVDSHDVDEWTAAAKHGGGALADEVRSRFERQPRKYGHVIVDEAQDMSLLELRAVTRRAKGVTLVGDDAQRSRAAGIGLRRAAADLDAPLEQLATSYRMSAEIAEWLNEHAQRHRIDAVELLGIRPSGIAVVEASDVPAAASDLRSRWQTVAVIRAGETWGHKGIEYDAVVVDAEGMSAAEMYLAASRAAHELVIVR